MWGSFRPSTSHLCPSLSLSSLSVRPSSVSSPSTARSHNTLQTYFSWSACAFSSSSASSSSSSSSCFVWGDQKALAAIVPTHAETSPNFLVPTKIHSPDGSQILSLAFSSTQWSVEYFATHHHAMLTSTGLFMWGHNSDGQLGNGTKTTATTPQKVEGLPRIASVALGKRHSLALDEDGNVWSWGMGSKWYFLAGALGHGSSSSEMRPKQIAGLKDIAAICSGDYHSLALSRDGKVYAWGRGEFGVLGTGYSSDEKSPVPVIGLEKFKVVKIRSGPHFNCALTSDGDLYVFGRNESGQLGLGPSLSLGTYALSSVPEKVIFGERSEPMNDEEDRTEIAKNSAAKNIKIVDAQCGENHMLAITESGQTYLWGNRLAMTPKLVVGQKGSFARERIVRVGAGAGYSLFSDPAGHLFAMGNGKSPCLGIGTKALVTSPMLVKGFGPSATKEGHELNPHGAVKEIFAGPTAVAVITSPTR